MRCIGVEKNLTNVKSFLCDRGYSVKQFEENEINSKAFLSSVDFIVTTGETKNFLGFNNSSSKIPIISAEGLSPEDVERQIIKSK